LATTRPETPGSAPVRLFGRDPRELAQVRELTANLVRRDLKVRHRGTFLGMVWSLTNPLLVVGLYYLVFKILLPAPPAKDLARPDGHAVPFALYLFCGLTAWNLYSTSAIAATESVTGSGYLLRKVYFPRAILPLATVLSSLVTFAFELAVLVVATLLFVGPPNLQVLWLPLVVVVIFTFAYGAALFLSALTVFLRDVAHFIGIALQLWFWGTPIVYSLQFIGVKHPSLAHALRYNPMTGVVVGFRNALLLGHAPDFRLLGYSAGCAVVLLGLGLWTFNHWQRLFPEIV